MNKEEDTNENNEQLEQEELVETQEQEIEETAETSTEEQDLQDQNDIDVESLLQSEFPDETFETDEAKQAGIKRLVKNLTDYRTTNREKNKVVVDALRSDDALRAIFNDVATGIPYRAAHARHVDPEDMIPKEGDDDFQDYQTQREKRLAELEETQKFHETIDGNRSKSAETIKRYAEEKGWSEEQTNERLAKLDQLLEDIYQANITDEMLDIIDKGVSFEKAVADAEEAGAIKTRNEKIELKRETKKPDGDGIPKLKSGDKKIKDEGGSLNPYEQSIKDHNEKRSRMNSLLD